MILQWTFEAVNKPCNHVVGWPRGQVDSGSGGHHYTDYATSADATLSPLVARPRPRPRPRRRPRTWLPEFETHHTVRPNTLEPWRIRRPLQTNTGRTLPPNYLLLFWLLYLWIAYWTLLDYRYRTFLKFVIHHITYKLSLTNLQKVIVIILEF